MHIKLYAITAALILTAVAIYGWSVMGPTMFMDLVTAARMCF